MARGLENQHQAPSLVSVFIWLFTLLSLSFFTVLAFLPQAEKEINTTKINMGVMKDLNRSEMMVIINRLLYEIELIKCAELYQLRE